MKSVAMTLLPFLWIVYPYVLVCNVKNFKILKNYQCHQPANDNSTSDGNDENRLLKFNVPVLPGNNYGLAIYKNSLRIIATLLSNKISQTISDQTAFTEKQTIVMPLN